MGYEIVTTFHPESRGSIVKIEKGAILKKEQFRYLQLKLQNTSKLVLKEVNIEIKCFNREGINLGTQTYTYSNLFIPSGEIWGTDVAILLENSETESVELFIDKNNICYIDVETKRKKRGVFKTGIPIVDEKKNGWLFLISISFSIFFRLCMLPFALMLILFNDLSNVNLPIIALLFIPLFFTFIMEILFLLALKKGYSKAALFNTLALVACIPYVYLVIMGNIIALLLFIIFTVPLLYQSYYINKNKN